MDKAAPGTPMIARSMARCGTSDQRRGGEEQASSVLLRQEDIDFLAAVLYGILFLFKGSVVVEDVVEEAVATVAARWKK